MIKKVMFLILLSLITIICYAQSYTLEVSISGMSDSLTVLLDPPGGVYAEPTLVTLTAVGDGIEYFYMWYGDLTGTGNPATLYVDGPKSVTASFLHDDPPPPTPPVSPPPIEYRIYIDIIGSVSGSTVTVDPPGPDYSAPTTVTLTANAVGEDIFTGWGGALSGQDNPATLIVDGEKRVTAYFIHGDSPAPGSVWFIPQEMKLLTETTKTNSLYTNSGDQRLAGYGYTILFDESIVQVDQSVGNSGVTAGSDGFVAAVNATEPGKLVIAGFDVSGTGPGANLEVVNIAWKGVSEGTTQLDLTIDALHDNNTVIIGSPQAMDGSITVVRCSLRGDVNESNTVDIVDALLIAQDYVGINPVNFNPDCADVNCDGTVDIIDALLVAQFYVGIITSFC